MTTQQWLLQAEAQLKQAGIETAHLDAIILLEDCLHIDRAYIFTYPYKNISATALVKLNKLLKQRLDHTPLAYIRGFSEFYGHTFLITPAVLEPRPESEAMIEMLLRVYKHINNLKFQSDTVRIADVGTGSGAIGITAKILLPNVSIDLFEIDNSALNIAKRNVDKFTLNISVIKSDLLSQASINYDILLCNLPYVPDDFPINAAAAKEPRIAIFGGPDGLDVYRKLFNQIDYLQQKPLCILTECFPAQQALLREIAAAHDFKLVENNDFISTFQRIRE